MFMERTGDIVYCNVTNSPQIDQPDRNSNNKKPKDRIHPFAVYVCLAQFRAVSHLIVEFKQQISSY